MTFEGPFQELRLKALLSLNRSGLRRKAKVFAIGFNKTGTSSLHVLFESMGLASYHGTAWSACTDLKLLRSYDCFSDGPPADVAKLDHLFPDARFILQVRDLDAWVYSRLAHIERKKEKVEDYRTGPNWNTTEESIESWIRRRNEHHLRVLSYFSGRPQDLLIINFIRDKMAATRICAFLGQPGAHERPRENPNPKEKRPQRHVDMLRSCAERIGLSEDELGYDLLCPSLLGKDTRSGFPVDTGFLYSAKTGEVSSAISDG